MHTPGTQVALNGTTYTLTQWGWWVFWVNKVGWRQVEDLPDEALTILATMPV